jgi:hypothetical protein
MQADLLTTPQVDQPGVAVLVMPMMLASTEAILTGSPSL